MGRKKSHGRGRGFGHKDAGVPIRLSEIVRNFATEQEIRQVEEIREARKARKFREGAEKRERIRLAWQEEKRTAMQRAGLPESALEKFRPHLRGTTVAERTEDERQQFFAWLEKTTNSVVDSRTKAMMPSAARKIEMLVDRINEES